MPNTESLRSGRAARCAVCDGKFGLVRYYSWRMPLCSKKCVDRFRARREGDCNWLPWLQIASAPPPENRSGVVRADRASISAPPQGGKPLGWEPANCWS